MEPIQQKLTSAQLNDIVFRNEVLCDLIGFKQYIPNETTKQTHEDLHQRSLRWFVIPNIGRYNSFELRFHVDYNWLVSAVVEFKKYDGLHKQGSEFDILYKRLKSTSVIDINLTDLYYKITDYAIAVWQQKQKEKK